MPRVESFKRVCFPMAGSDTFTLKIYFEALVAHDLSGNTNSVHSKTHTPTKQSRSQSLEELKLENGF